MSSITFFAAISAVLRLLALCRISQGVEGFLASSQTAVFSRRTVAGATDLGYRAPEPASTAPPMTPIEKAPRFDSEPEWDVASDFLVVPPPGGTRDVADLEESTGAVGAVPGPRLDPSGSASLSAFSRAYWLSRVLRTGYVADCIDDVIFSSRSRAYWSSRVLRTGYVADCIDDTMLPVRTDAVTTELRSSRHIICGAARRPSPSKQIRNLFLLARRCRRMVRHWQRQLARGYARESFNTSVLTNSLCQGCLHLNYT